jgi:hypothetical protein
MSRICLAVLAISLSVGVVCMPGLSHAQLAQPLYVIDKPTAGMLPSGSYLLRGRAGAESSFLVSAYVGFREIVQIGASFGAQNMFEHGNPVVNDYPGFHARIRFMQEGERVPALALGFDSQGYGVYHEGLERYDRKSPGFYGVLSKNWVPLLGQLSLHGGVSWSTENKDDNDPNLFGAMDWTFFEHLAFLLDVDAGLNDNEDTSFGSGGVYVDAGIGWYFSQGLFVSLAFRDLTDNFAPTPGVSRELDISWRKSF